MVFYLTDEATLCVRIGPDSKAGTLEWEEFLLFVEGTAAKQAATACRRMRNAKVGGLLAVQTAQVPHLFKTTSGRNPTKRTHAILTNEALTDNPDQTTIEAGISDSVESMTLGLGFQVDALFGALNGVELLLSGEGVLPSLEPQRQAAEAALELPPLSVAFVAIPGANASACI